jgi:hypothetical protein
MHRLLIAGNQAFAMKATTTTSLSSAHIERHEALFCAADTSAQDAFAFSANNRKTVPNITGMHVYAWAPMIVGRDFVHATRRIARGWLCRRSSAAIAFVMVSAAPSITSTSLTDSSSGALRSGRACIVSSQM